MAITARAQGTWATLTADGAVTIPGSPVDGDMMYLLVAWKPFGTTAQVTSPAGWTELTEFTDGAVANGNGVGSVKVACYYKQYAAGDTNPTVDFSASPDVAGAVIIVFQKGATETWDAPRFVTAAMTNWTTSSQTVTASSTTRIDIGDLIVGLIGIRDDSATMTRPTTGIAAAGVTFSGNYVEYPATHLSTTTGFDLAVDAGYRIVSAGPTTVAPTMTGTISAAETGAALWLLQGVSPAGLGQAQASIKVTDTEFGQAQAAIKLLGRAVAQSQALISTNIYTATDTFTRSETDQWGVNDTGSTWTLYGAPASQWDVNGTAGTFIAANTSVNGQALYGVTSGRISESTINITRVSSGASTGTTFIYLPLHGLITGARISIIESSSAASIIGFKNVTSTSSSSFGTITTGINYTLKTQIFQTSPSSARIRVKMWATSGTEPGWQIDQTITDAVGDFSYPGLYILPGNSTVQYTFDNFSKKEIPWTESGQAQAFIAYKQVRDTYTRSVSNSWSSAETGGVYTVTAGSTNDYDVTGTEGTISLPLGAQGHNIHLAQVAIRDSATRFKFKLDRVPTLDSIAIGFNTRRIDASNDYNPFVLIQTDLDMILGADVHVGGSGSGVGAGIDTGINFAADTYYWFYCEVVRESPTNTQIRSRLWLDGNTEPNTWTYIDNDTSATLQTVNKGWEIEVIQYSASEPTTLFTIDDLSVDTWYPTAQGQAQAEIAEGAQKVHGQSQGDIKQTYFGLGQANADIKQTYFALGQSQANIKQTYFALGQSQAEIKQTYYALGQSQADIKQVYYGLGQSNAEIKQIYRGLGQAQSDIKQTYYELGQSQADIKQTYRGLGQAQARILTTYFGLGQAQARILTTYFALGQAEAWIENTYFALGQTQAWVENTYFGLGQAQANIENTYNQHGQANASILATSYVHGQSQADIKQTYSQTGQTQALIGRVVIFDDFNRTIADGWGTSTDESITWHRHPDFPLQPFSVDGSTGLATGSGQVIQINYYAGQVIDGVYQVDILSPSSFLEQNINFHSYGYIWSMGFSASEFGYNGITGSSGNSTAILSSYEFDTWYTFKVRISPSPNTSWTKIWKRGEQEPDWGDDGAVVPYLIGDTVLLVQAYSENQIDNYTITTVGNILHLKQAQAQAIIKATNNTHGQAGARIKGDGALVWLKDTFTRTESGTWGTPDIGPTYIYDDAPTDLSVTGTKGTLIPVAGYSSNYIYSHIDAYNVDYTIDIQRINQDAFYAELYLRLNLDFNSYIAFEIYDLNPTTLGLYAYDSDFGTLDDEVEVSVSSLNAPFRIRVRSNGNKAFIKVWEISTPEPDWQGSFVTTVFTGGAVAVYLESYVDEDENYYSQVDNWNVTEVLDLAPGQAQARIKQTYPLCVGGLLGDFTLGEDSLGDGAGCIGAFGQAQATIAVDTNRYVHGQAQGTIEQTYTQSGQAQGTILRTYTQHGQSQALIVVTGINAHGQSAAIIRDTYYGSGQSQAQIQQTYYGTGQAQATVRGNAHGQAQGQIKQTYTESGQSQALIKNTYYGSGQANAWIEQTYFGLGQAQGTIKQSYTQTGQAQGTILQTYVQTGQSQAWIKTVDVNVHGQAQGTVLQSYTVTGQANARIIAFGVNAYGQAQANIRFDGNAVHGQAQARVFAFDYNQHGQAQGTIENTYNVHGQSGAQIKQTYTQVAQAQGTIENTYNVHGQAQGIVKATTNVHSQSQAYIIRVDQNVHGQANADIKQTYYVHGQANALIGILSRAHGQAQAAILRTYNQHGQAQGQIKQTYVVSGQAQAVIRDTYSASGQAQAYILLLRQGYGQAQATIEVTNNRSGQTQAQILQSYVVHGNAQSRIRTTLNSCGQAQALVGAKSSQSGQAQALIQSGQMGHGQAQAFIFRHEAFGQAQGFVKTVHTLANVTGDDERVITVTGSDDADEVDIEIIDDTPMELEIIDDSITVTGSDDSMISVTIIDEAFI